MMGVGTLIIFISMILVAAVASSVLIATSSRYQQSALSTASSASAGVSTGLEALSVHGIGGLEDSNIDSFEVIVRARAGSDNVNLNTTLIILETSTKSQRMAYRGEPEADDSTLASSTAEFLAYYLQSSGEGSINHVGRSDLVKLKFNAPAEKVGEGKKVRIRVMPRFGSTLSLEFTTPDFIFEERIALWP